MKFCNRTHFRTLLLPAMLIVFCSAEVAAQTVRDDVGYTKLLNQLGAATPTGAGLSIGIIEPLQAGKNDTNTVSWLPAPDVSEISHVKINPISLGSTFDSGHAAQISKWLFSADYGLASGIATANFYHLEDFIARHLIPRAAFIAPSQINHLLGARVFENRINNFSSVGNYDSGNAKILRQFDWATATEDTINVISAGNSFRSRAIFSSSYNGIYVGVTHPISGRVGAPIDNLYNGARQRPDIVAPSINTSRGTAVASSITTVLMESAANAAYSKASTNLLFTKQNAQKSEAIKAILMAGADRATKNTRINTFLRNPDRTFIRDKNGKIITKTSDITNYRGDGFRTDNGLDTRYGAGQANVFNSHEILTAGEQDSQEDGGEQTVSLLGFDYDEAFGNGTSFVNPNSVASYLLPTLTDNVEFYLTLAWNLDVYGGDGLFESASLYDLDLWLYDVTGDEDILVNFSASSNANTETIAQILLEDHDYEFRVTSEKNVTALLWDYAIAWRTEYIDDGNSPDDLTADDFSSAAAQPFTAVNAQAVPLPTAGWLFLSAITGLIGVKRAKYLQKIS